MLGNPITFKEQLYGDTKLQVLDAMSLGKGAMLASSLQITYAITNDRFWFSTSTKALKKALDARATPPAENITAKADFASRFVEPPKGATLTELSYGDTAANFENGYGQLTQVLSMVLAMQSGLMQELPLDISMLPTAEAISKHLFGTVTIGYSTGQNGHVTVTRGPFGAETVVAVAGGAAAVAALVGVRADQAAAARNAAATAHREEKKAGDPSDRAKADLADLSTAITVFTIENGKPPATLDELVKPTTDYPNGMLNGATKLPTDPWGHAYSYKTQGAEGYVIWSFGPNGVDDGGASDDVVQRGG
jgi:general secretion pathway protein G